MPASQADLPPLAVRVVLSVAVLGGAFALMLIAGYLLGRVLGAWLRLRCTHCLGPVAYTGAGTRLDGPVVRRGLWSWAGWCPRCRCFVEAVRLPRRP